MMKEAEYSTTETWVEDEQPIYFLDLVIDNVRCFGKQQQVDFSDGQGKPARWNIILGDNGTGKTTLLKCLAGLEPIFVGGAREIIHTGQALDFKSEFTFSRHSGEDFSVKVSHFYKGSLRGEIGGAFATDYGFQEVHAELLPYKHIKELVIYAYGASRRMGTGSLEESYSPDNAISLFSENVTLINAVEWLLQADYAVKTAEEGSRLYFENRYARVKNMLLDLFPREVNDIRVKLLSKTASRPMVEVKTAYGWISMRDLSLGYQALIAWMVDLAHRLFERYPESSNPLKEPAIVLVDEIDLHLHPKWQRILINRLMTIFENTQFIVTAHSPLIVQASPQGTNIILLKREADRVIIYNHKDEEAIKHWRIDQILVSDLFEVPTAKSSEYDKYVQRRSEILSQATLSDADQKELIEIEKKLHEPAVVEDNKIRQMIRKATDMLKMN